MSDDNSKDAVNTIDLFGPGVGASSENEMVTSHEDSLLCGDGAPFDEPSPEASGLIAFTDGDSGPGHNSALLPGSGHNHRVYVRDLLLDARFHERRSFDPDDLARLSQLVADPALHRPVPVIEKDGRFAYVDSTVFCKALLESDPNAMVEIEIVSESDGLAIRFRDIAKRSHHEPMSKVRLACMLVEAGFSGERAGDLLGVKAARISQLVAVARTEAEFEAMAKLITNPFGVTPRLWSSIHDTRIAREKADEKKPNKTGPSRVQKFEEDIAQIVADGEPISVNEIRTRLDLNDTRTARKSVRMLGTPVSLPGLEFRLNSDERRRSFSVDPSYPKADFKALVNKVAEFLIEQQKKRDGSATKN
jgi:hypothetical protein